MRACEFDLRSPSPCRASCSLAVTWLASRSASSPISDLLKFVWIADPQVSPDGRQVVFVRVVVNEKTDDYDTSVWIVPATVARRRAR